MISTKRYHSGNIVKVYVADNHQVSTTQTKDSIKSVNVNLEFGNERDHVDDKFTLD